MVIGILTTTGNGKHVIFLLWPNEMVENVECMGEWRS